MSDPIRIDQLSREEIAGIQGMVGAAGFDPGAIDGIWGPGTAQAYADYVATRQKPSMIVQPAPAKPWWQSRAILGALVAIAATVAGLAGWEVDRAQLTEIVLQVVALAGAVLAWWGTVRRKGPIDPTAVLPHVRLPSGVHEVRLPAGIVPAREPDDPRGNFSDS